MNKNEIKYLELKKLGIYNNVELAEKVGVSVASIFNYQKKNNLTSDFKREYIESLSLYEKSALIGTLLGDAWLTRASKSSYRGGMSHKKDNKDYVLYKMEVLKPICVGEIYYKLSNSGFGNNNESYYTRFKSSPLLKDVYENMYSEGKKKINKYVLKHFTDISLAFYYQDDGSKLKGKNGWHSYKFAMYDYDINCRKNLKELLLKKWNIHSSVTKTGLSISAKSREKFKYLILPYIVDSMKYKL